MTLPARKVFQSEQRSQGAATVFVMFTLTLIRDEQAQRQKQ
jgi:hypothetical protein